jgi:hypothetical protein
MGRRPVNVGNSQNDNKTHIITLVRVPAQVFKEMAKLVWF